MLQNGRLSLFDTLSAALAVLGVLFAGTGSLFDAPGIQLAGPVFWFVTAATLVFEHWAWRWRILFPLTVARPDFRGMWKGELLSTWSDPESGASPAPIEVYFAIRQTFSGVHVRMISSESSSDTVSAGVSRERSGSYLLTGTYLNEPGATVRHLSAIHYGTLRLSTAERHPTSLEGDYWTGRKTTGEIHLSARENALHDTFAAAKRAFD